MATYPTDSIRAANLALVEALGLNPTTVEDPEAPFPIRDGRLTFTEVDVFAGETHRQARTVDVPAEIAAQYAASTRLTG